MTRRDQRSYENIFQSRPGVSSGASVSSVKAWSPRRPSNSFNAVSTSMGIRTSEIVGDARASVYRLRGDRGLSSRESTEDGHEAANIVANQLDERRVHVQSSPECVFRGDRTACNGKSRQLIPGGPCQCTAHQKSNRQDHLRKTPEQGALGDLGRCISRR